MKILGIYEGHNANAALVVDGQIARSTEEERFSRIKNHDSRTLSSPLDAIRFCIEGNADIDFVALALEEPASLSHNAFSSFLEDLSNPARKERGKFLTEDDYRVVSRFGGMNSYNLPAFPGISQTTRVDKIKSALEHLGLGDIPVYFVNHHMAHNASAYYTSGKERGLCLSLDGKGDDLSGMACLAADGKVEELGRVNFIDSIGHFYSAITVALGFKAIRHEGKITGLAAYGKEIPELQEKFEALFYIDDEGALRSKLADGLKIGPYPHTDFGLYVDKVRALVDGYSREDVAFGAQKTLEKFVCKWAQYWVNKTGESNVFLSGGVFANVRLNQAIMNLDGVGFLYIHPAMSDAGLGAGAALHASYNNSAAAVKYEPRELTHVYFGKEFSDEEIEACLKDHGVDYEAPASQADAVADLLSQGKIIALYQGGVEYGPRSLGNRSVLYHTKDPSVNDWLNKQLNRTEFMPFAPVTLMEEADNCYVIPEGKDVKYTCKFMTLTLDCKESMKEASPAVVHIDGTARPQLICRENNELYYDILKAYFEKTGIPSLVNTSFNMHEEPIVCSPDEAVVSFQKSNIDYLSIGRFLVKAS